MLRATVAAGAIRVDDTQATLVTVAVNARAPFLSGFINGEGVGDDTPTYIREAAELRGLRTMREWAPTVSQKLHRHVNIKAGTPLVHYQTSRWMQGGVCPHGAPGGPEHHPRNLGPPIMLESRHRI